MTQHQVKTWAASLSVASNSFLVIFKIGVGWWIGSVSVISEAIHSGIDLLASIIALVAVTVASRPADEGHPFGHGKFENISGAIEALLIFVASGWILYEAVPKFWVSSETVSMPLWGSAVMLLSVIVNSFVSRYLFKVGKETDSIALTADAWHLRTDIFTSMGVMVALALMGIFQWVWPSVSWHWIDPLGAIFVSLLIMRASYTLTIEAGRDLLDVSLPLDEIETIKKIIRQHKQVKGFHRLRSRKAGPYRFIEFHLVLDPDMPLKESHQLTDELTLDIKKIFSPIHVTIHTEPCDHQCNPVCMEGCIVGKEEEIEDKEFH